MTFDPYRATEEAMEQRRRMQELAEELRELAHNEEYSTAGDAAAGAYKNAADMIEEALE